MKLPENTNLPFFAYGLFKPGELAHRQIKDYIDGNHKKALISGSLWIRDGLPLFKPSDDAGDIPAFLIYFNEKNSKEAYEIISDFEPEKQYYWIEKVLIQPEENVNVLVGRSPEKGSIECEGGIWNGNKDPVFSYGIVLVKEITNNFARKKFDPSPPDTFDWIRLFRLQMAYLLLWTSIERYTSLSYGPSLDPMQKIKFFGEDPAFKTALKKVLIRTDKVYDSRNPENYEKLDPDNPSSSAKYYYQIRNNLSNRGKGAWKDGEKVRESLLELLEIFRTILIETMQVIDI